MAAPAHQRPRYTLDTNVMIDLGEGKPFAQRFLATFKGYGLACPPTVIQELMWLSKYDSDAKIRKIAFDALFNMRRWNIFPYDLKSVGHGISELTAQKLMDSGILPDGELHDGQIIVETSLACIPNLITSDIHLLGINPTDLAQKLTEFDLNPVSVFHPKDRLR